MQQNVANNQRNLYFSI